MFGPGSEDRSPIYVNRMLKGLRGYSGRSLFVLSGQDLVAQQFRQLVTVDGRWKNALDRDGTDIANFEGADHTFSYRVHREQLEQRVLAWLS